MFLRRTIRIVDGCIRCCLIGRHLILHVLHVLWTTEHSAEHFSGSNQCECAGERSRIRDRCVLEITHHACCVLYHRIDEWHSPTNSLCNSTCTRVCWITKDVLGLPGYCLS